MGRMVGRLKDEVNLLPQAAAETKSKRHKWPPQPFFPLWFYLGLHGLGARCPVCYSHLPCPRLANTSRKHSLSVGRQEPQWEQRAGPPVPVVFSFSFGIQFRIRERLCQRKACCSRRLSCSAASRLRSKSRLARRCVL